VLGRAADVWGYAPSYLIAAGIEAVALPFLALSRRQKHPADTLEVAETQPAPQPALNRPCTEADGLDPGQRSVDEIKPAAAPATAPADG
jgi:hypothetical protein